jgi:hypothetical protein
VSLPGSLSEEVLDELWPRAYDICQYEAGNLEVDGHRWCVLAGGDAVDTLAAFRIEAQLRQAD